MKHFYFLPIILLLFCACNKDCIDYGVGAPELSIIMNDQSGQSLLPDNTEEFALKLEHEVVYEANGIPQEIIQGDNIVNTCLTITELVTREGEPIALRPLPYDFGFKLVEAAKATPDCKCHATVRLKCPGIFQDEKEHLFEMDLEYCGNKRYEILQVVKGTLTIDGEKAEYMDYKTYKINMNIKKQEP